MNPIRLSAALALLAVAAPAPAVAETVVPVPRFNSVQLRGGGEVRLRHGPVQRVIIVRGSTAHTDIRLRNDGGRRSDTLAIDACNDTCPRNYDLLVEIVTPDLKAVAVDGGGAVHTLGRFPSEDSLAVAVNGGGHIDVRSAGASSVAAAVNGGGTIFAQPRASLAAAIRGGGDIRYWGNPSVVTSINGGGTVTRGGTR